MKMSFCAVLTGCLAVVSMSGAAMGDEILAVSWSGNAYSIDSDTGGGTLLGGTGYGSLNAMTQDGSGRYLTQVRGTDQLLEIDPVTGVGSLLSNLSMSMDVRGFAYGGGTLYAVHEPSFGVPDELYKINPDTGSATFIGTTNHNGIQGLAYAPDGTLYGWDVDANTQGGLIVIDKSNGVSSTVGGPTNGEIQTIAFDADGTLWGCRNDLYSISLASGNYTLEHLGNGRYSDVRGMSFIGGASDCLTLDVTALNAGSVATWSVSGATPNAEVAVVYGHDPGDTVINGYAGYCADFGIRGVNQNRVICRKRADGGGELTCRVNIPDNASGVRVLSQAAERDTCPDTCMSNLDDQVVG